MEKVIRTPSLYTEIIIMDTPEPPVLPEAGYSGISTGCVLIDSNNWVFS